MFTIELLFNKINFDIFVAVQLSKVRQEKVLQTSDRKKLHMN